MKKIAAILIVFCMFIGFVSGRESAACLLFR